MIKKIFPPGPQNVLYIFTIFVFGIAAYYLETGTPPLLMALIGGTIGLLANILFIFLFKLLGKGINKLPLKTNAIILGSIATLYLAKSTILRFPDQAFIIASIIGIICAFLFYYGSKNPKKSSSSQLAIAAGVIFLSTGIYWLHQNGNDPYAEKLPAPIYNTNFSTLSSQGLKNPALKGNYKTSTFTYGSGTDKKRKEFAASVKFKTPTVNATRLLPDWKEKKKKWRERYWKFGVKNFPLNGRAYMPEGKGPFPIVLIVHGNHSMIDYSDNGYGYLGELLASRGFITVSVDENFINGHWSGDFRGKEMPTRAWLLLKHLEQWKKWNNDSSHELFNKVDLENIMLVGHSRGGEAVSIAAAFNQLNHFPDNALEEFDFYFGIKGIVTLAPTDYRYDRKIKLQNINYLSLQGSYDSDEISFWGMRPFRRLKFTNGKNYFKAGVYIHRANHGQFNSTWGRTDFGGTFKWLLNTAPLISGKDQREIAKIFISAFAEASLKNNENYLPIFKNISVAKDWLPENYYLTHFQNGQSKILADFEKDIQLSSEPNNISIKGNNLKIWREENLRTRDKGSQENNAVVLGWDYGGKINTDSLATYSLIFPDSVFMETDSATELVISVAAGNYKELKKEKKKEKGKTEKQKKREEPQLDFTISLADKNGETAKIPISEIKKITPMLKSKFTKLKSLDQEMIGNDWEVHLDGFHIPIAIFLKSNEKFNFREIKNVSLVFDQCLYGVIVVDNVGVTY